MKNHSPFGQMRVVRRQRGFSLVTAIFLITILMLLSAYMIGCRVFQDSSISLDTLATRAYAAARAGVDARLSIYPEAPHTFPLMGDLPESATARGEIAAFLREGWAD